MAKKNLLLQFVMGRNNILTGLIPKVVYSHIHSVTPFRDIVLLCQWSLATLITNQREEYRGLFRNVFIHVWFRLEFSVSNRMSFEFSRDLIITGAKFDVAGEKFTIVEKEKQFILENLSEARIESASNYGYGFLEGGTEGRVPRAIYSVRFHVFCSIKDISRGQGYCIQ